MSPQAVRSRICLAEVETVILAGGLGTRVKGVLGDTPKVLAPIGGRPFIEYLLDWLTGFGARKVILSLGHRAEQVVEFLNRNPRRDMELEASVEPEPLGTAGGLRHVRGRLSGNPVLVLNGDSFVDADLCVFLGTHRGSAPLASILCAEVADTSRYGRVETDRLGRIVKFVEKGAAAGEPGLVNAGVYLFSSAFLDRLAAREGASLEKDFLEPALSASIRAFPCRGAFIDIGTPESLEAAAAVLERAIPAPGLETVP